MKLKNTNKKENILTILLFPVALLFVVFIFIITPFDYLKYKKSQYYKDTHEKYSWLCTSSYYIKFYDLVKKANLPIDYYRCDYAHITGYGFFVYKDTLILNDYEPCYDEEKNIWLVEIEDEYVDIKTDVDNAIDRCNDLLNNDTCKKAVVLIDKDLFEKYPTQNYENIKFWPISSDMDIEAIKLLLEFLQNSKR